MGGSCAVGRPGTAGGGNGLVVLLRSVLLIVAASACTSSPAAASVGFRCSVEGEDLLGPNVTAKAVCARIKAVIDRELGAVTRLEEGRESNAEWLGVEVRFTNPGVASAQMRRNRGGRVTTLPDLNISVMDRPLGLDTVDELSVQLGRQLR